DSQTRSPLLAAATYGHVDLVRKLLQSPSIRAQVAANDNEALKAAMVNGHTAVVKELLRYDAVKTAAAEDKSSQSASKTLFFKLSPHRAEMDKVDDFRPRDFSIG